MGAFVQQLAAETNTHFINNGFASLKVAEEFFHLLGFSIERHKILSLVPAAERLASLELAAVREIVEEQEVWLMRK